MAYQTPAKRIDDSRLQQSLTYSTEQLHSKRSEDVEEQKEEKSEIADFRQSLHDSVEQSAHRPGHLEQLEHCAT